MRKHLGKYMLALILAVVSLGTTACGGGAAGGKLKLVSDGRSDYVIVVPTEATEAEQYAAEELQSFFAQSTSVTLPIVKDGEEAAKNSKILSVGHTAQFEKSGIALDEEKLGSDGFLMESKGDTIYMTGAEDRGTLYSCYDFLERYLGIRFFAVDETKIPEYTDLSVGDIHVEEVPDFVGRDSHQYESIYNPAFSARVRLNGVRTNLGAKYGYGMCTEWSSQWAHTFQALLPWNTYGEEHPEWYSADQAWSQICLTNPEVEKELVENLKKLIEKESDAKYFSVSQEDIVGPCQCENCVASDAKYFASGTLIRFVNQVAADIKEWADEKYPEREIYIVTFSYQHTLNPPVRTLADGTKEPIDETVIPADNVYIRTTSIWNCFEHALMDTNCSTNLTYYDSLTGWACMTDRLMVWNYEVNFSNYLLPFNNYQTMAENFKTFRDYGFVDILDQGASDGPHTEMQELKTYVQAKLMWDVDQDVNALIDEFVEGYYKEAAPYVKKYLEMQRVHFASLDADGGFHMQLYGETPNITNPDSYPRRYLEQQIELFEQALEEVSKLPQGEERTRLEQRVKAASLAPRYLVLINYLTYYDESSLEEFAREFFDDCDLVGVTKFAEGNSIYALRDQYLDD